MQPIAVLNKTQLNMYSTMTPTGQSLKHREHSNNTRSSRYRHMNATTKGFNPQAPANISSSISKEYRAQTIMLPGIKREKGFMLEEWLNDALEGDEGAGIKEPLRTLKKYQMDKASLRNANMSLEQIGTLYNGLFVYTSGIKNAFEEMFKSASLQDRDDHKIEKTYWKIFIKLLENTIPVKTCFQIIEDEYRREISNLRRTIVDQHAKKDAMREDYEEQLRRLRREVEELDRRQKEFQKDFKVMNSNLILYEESFNEEVFLRLKFQEKINQVYSSYDQLKEKFESLRQELTYKTQQLMETQKENSRLQNKLNDELIKSQDIMEKLQIAESRLAQRQSEITIKNQEIADIKQENHDVDEKKKLEEIALDELITTIKVMRKNKVEHDKKIGQLKEVIAANEETVRRLKDSLYNARQKNDQVYLKYHEATIKNRQMEDAKLKLSIELQETKAKLMMAENKLAIVKGQKEEYAHKLASLQVQLSIKAKDLHDKDVTIEIFDSTIAQLKSIKDRYERLNDLLKGELESSKDQLQRKIKELGQEKAKIFDYKYQTDKLLRANEEQEIAILNLKKIIDTRETELATANNSFKNRLAEAYSKTKEVQTSLQEQQKELSKVNDSLSKKDNDKLSKIEEMAFAKKKNSLMERQLLEKRQKVKELLEERERNAIEMEKLRRRIQSKEFILNQKREEIDGEILTLKMSIAKYKQALEDKEQYVHPFIYEDQRSLVIQLQHKLNHLRQRQQSQTNQ